VNNKFSRFFFNISKFSFEIKESRLSDTRFLIQDVSHKCHIQHAITFTVTVNNHLNMLLLGEMSNSCSCTEQYGCRIYWTCVIGYENMTVNVSKAHTNKLYIFRQCTYCILYTETCLNWTSVEPAFVRNRQVLVYKG
jgi:hypothetical protein